MTIRDICGRGFDRLYNAFPCLSDPGTYCLPVLLISSGLLRVLCLFLWNLEWKLRKWFVFVWLSSGGVCFIVYVLFAARRSSLGLKAALVMLHLVFVGILFLFSTDLIEKTKREPWYYNFVFFVCEIYLISLF